MLLSLLAISLGAVVGATGLLLVAGHRVRRSSWWRNVALAIGGAVVSGEVVGTVLALPSSTTLFAEVVLAGTAVAIGRLRPRWNAVGVWFFASVVVAASAYVGVAATVTFGGGLSALATVAPAAVLGLEVAALSIAATFAFETCDVACRTGPDRVLPPLVPEHQPFVSLHVAAYNEPPDMLIDTIRSLEAIDYPHFEIVVIDNNTRDEDVWRPVEAYCAGRDRVTFVHVDPWPGFKSGALNHVLAEHTDPRAEIIGVVDADYLVEPHYLARTVGHFAEPSLAFLQTPQDYREWEGDMYLTALHDSYAYFFAAAMRSRNQRNSIIFGGTMGLIRRSVLEEIGGWDEWCITEDAEASFRMLRAGYQGLYLHESFGRGIMPLTFGALKRQRFRWCFGGIQILRKHWRSMLPWHGGAANRLSLPQRLDYLIGGTQWFIDLVTLGFTAVALAAAALAVTGQPVAFRPLLGAAVMVPIVLGGTGLLRALWALRRLNGIGTRRALLAFLTWLSLSWTVALACAKGLVRRDGVFLRTPKWSSRGGIVEAMRATGVESSLAATLWAAAVVVLGVTGARSRLLSLLLVWQGAIYASGPLMAWLNQHTELSARLERRARTEDRRERLLAVQPHLLRGSLVVLVIAVLALAGAGAGDSGEPRSLQLPQRDRDDRGPLGNVLSGEGPTGETTSNAEEPAPPSTDPLAPVTSDLSPASTVGPAGGGSPSATTLPSGPTTTTPPFTASTSTITGSTGTTTTTTTTTPAPTTSTTPSTSPPTSAAPPTSSPPTSTSPPTSDPPTSRPDR